ncbi:EAL and HDOD domain-containing protein [Derxia gummosa]|uniref:EAL and HDOD domain-containing protein n=1 Tax=Derxia gummosa DSM 723 TaxID=1121388 RepID=A0A8B6X6Z6_9BURK|nr:EAL domain-containing protein [Derxia gummosa]
MGSREPLTPGAADDAASHTFIARQPILDRDEKIVGYELLSRADETAEHAPVVHTRESDSILLFHALSNFGADTLFGDKDAFVNCALDALDGDHLELIHPERMVIEIADGCPPERIAEIGARLAALRERGFRLAGGGWMLDDAFRGWLPLLSHIKIDVRNLDARAAQRLLGMAALHGKLRLVAERVETREVFERFRELGFHLFQGYYFQRPRTLGTKSISPAHGNVLQLMDLARREADPSAVETVLKRDPALSFKLLRYINSSGFGLRCEVTSFRHAVMILGYGKLFRWLAVLFATVSANSVPPALARTVITRGRLMELLALKLLPKEQCDNAFVVGIFSALDAMLGMPMEKVLGSLSLPEEVTDALLERSGVFGPFLELVEACEGGDFDRLGDLALALQLEPYGVSEAHMSALAWTETLGV